MKKRKIRYDRLALVCMAAFCIFCLMLNFVLSIYLVLRKPKEIIKIVPQSEVQIVEPEEVPEPVIQPIEEILVPTETQELVYIGEFKLTGYCPCYECSEGFGTATATGTTCTAGRTVAVDPRVIPYGTKLLIGDHIYVAEDCGGAIKENKIDIYCDTHSECFSDFCNGYADVYIIVEERA